MLQWRPLLNPIFCAFWVILTPVLLYIIYRQIRIRMPLKKACLLILPKILVMFLLFMILFDPRKNLPQKRQDKSKILVLLDISSSMQVKDKFQESRIARAKTLLKELQKRMRSNVVVETLFFDTTIHKKEKISKKMRGTDLAGCLMELSEKSDISSYLGIVFFTDGGDERIQNIHLPPVPLYIAGIGTPPSHWNDLRIEAVYYPASVEQETDFAIQIDFKAQTGGSKIFQKYLSSIPVILQIKQKEKWLEKERQNIDLSRKRSRIKFKATASKKSGIQKYRVQIQNVPGEVSYLNNTRSFHVEVQKRSLHILFFTQSLNIDFKMLRNELGRDPGVTFTALFRIFGERFHLQGRRLPGDEKLQAGFPQNLDILKLYDCIIVGSFEAKYWQEKQCKTLIQYIEEGGSVIFLGGKNSFGRGKYASTSLAPLFPWQISNQERPLVRGKFPVYIASGRHPITSGLQELIVQEKNPVVESINQPGPLRPGAFPLINVALPRSFPIIAAQTFGKGQVMAVATNTLWRWARKSRNFRMFYGKFWRQAVRNLVNKSESGRILSVKWDRKFYRPGEEANLRIWAASTHNLTLQATLHFQGKSQQIFIQPSAKQKSFYNGKIPFKKRGEYLFRLVASQGQKILETYEKSLKIAPLSSEGSHLEVDQKFLKKLATTFASEENFQKIPKKINESIPSPTLTIETPIVREGPYFMLLLLLILAAEWSLRRLMNLF